MKELYIDGGVNRYLEALVFGNGRDRGTNGLSIEALQRCRTGGLEDLQAEISAIRGGFCVVQLPAPPLLENIERGPFCGSRMPAFRNFKNRSGTSVLLVKLQKCAEGSFLSKRPDRRRVESDNAGRLHATWRIAIPSLSLKA